MEQLFLIMWVADVVDSVIVSSIVGVAFTFLATGAFFCTAMNDNSIDKATKILIKGTCVIVGLMLFVVILPSKKTIHLYAAGSVAKEVAETPLGKKAYEAADAVLDKVIAETKK